MYSDRVMPHYCDENSRNFTTWWPKNVATMTNRHEVVLKPAIMARFSSISITKCAQEYIKCVLNILRVTYNS